MICLDNCILYVGQGLGHPGMLGCYVLSERYAPPIFGVQPSLSPVRRAGGVYIAKVY